MASGYTSGETSGGCLYITEYPAIDMKKITCTNGYYITTFRDLIDNILTYYSSTEERCNMNIVVEDRYRCIDAETDAEYKRLQKAAIEDMINA